MNRIYFVQVGGSSEPIPLCERHAGDESPFDAVSEALDETDEACVICSKRLNDEMLEVATEIIDTDGRGLRAFFNLLAGLLEVRADADDESSDLFRAALDGVERTVSNVGEIEIDRFSEGDAVLFAREVKRPPHFTVPMGTRGHVTLLRGLNICVTLDREVSGQDNEDYNAVWFEGAAGRHEFLDAVRKLPPPADDQQADS
ncbi:MAG: hypothetical protein ACJ74Q_15095 [Pyrinomonadaceae bacterium]